MAACSTLDCPLNNTVYTKYRLAGNITTLTDTLTISTNRIEGTDSVLIKPYTRGIRRILKKFYNRD